MYGSKKGYDKVFKSISEKIEGNRNDEYLEDNHKDNPDPFLFASSKVMSG